MAINQTSRSRFTPQVTAGLQLEARDAQLLGDLFLHRAMSRSQIQALYFSSVGRCNARLRQLFDHGYVTRYYPPAAPFGAQAVYFIGKAALPVVAKQLDMDISAVRSQYRRSETPTYIEHTLAIVDLYIAFREAIAQHPDVELERWLPEILCRHEYDIRANEQGAWHKEVFKPDAFVRLTHRDNNTYFNYFIEVDLGHTSSQQFMGKLMTHQRYLESGLFNEIFECSNFKTLVVTTTIGRLKNLKSLVAAQNSDLFWLTTFDSVRQEGAIESIWQVPLAAGLVNLIK